MAKTRRYISLDEKIEKTEELVRKRKEAYDHAVEELKVLREKKEKENQETLMKAVAESKWTYEQIIDILQKDPEDIDIE